MLSLESSIIRKALLCSGNETVRPTALTCLALMCFAASGCSFGNNLNAIPVSRVPREVLQTDLKDDYIDISLLRLRQDPPDTYLLGPGDMLGIYIKGVLGTETELPPVHYPEDGNRPPAIGYPVPIREDGTLALPLIDPIKVEGMSLVEATTAVRNAYIYPDQIIKEGEEAIIITLIQHRKIRVLVIREEGGGVADVTKRGTGHVVDLPAYENDVLHALSETGGMPGTDAKNEILIYRGLYSAGVNADTILNGLCQDCLDAEDPCFCNEAPVPDPPNLTRIPLRYHPSRPPLFTQQDIILGEGDIIIIRSRDDETFYTAGVLGGGEFPLPRDKDLDIIGAIALAGGPLGNSGTGVGAIGGGGGGGGGGFGGGRGGVQQQACQPSEAIVVRELPCGNQITIKIDLNRALQNPSERILIQPNDIVMVRFTIQEEIGNLLASVFQVNYLLGGGLGQR